MTEQNVLKVKTQAEIPTGYTGIAIYPHGSKEWYLNGKHHREDGPAVEWLDGSKQWWLNDRLHREDGPAKEYVDGRKEWYLNGNNYSEENWKKEVANLNVKPTEEVKTVEKKPDGPVVLNLKEGENVPDRFSGIAVWPNGNKSWRKDGKCHREDGPAVEWADGSKEWWLNGKHYFEDDWKKEVAKLNNKPAKEAKSNVLIMKDINEIVPKDFTGVATWPNSRKYWYRKGKLHREDGPAREWNNGSKEWFLNDKFYSEDDWKKALNKEQTKETIPMKEIEVNETTYSYSDAFKRGLKEGAKRAAVRKTRTIMLEALCSILTSKAEKTKQGETARTVLKRFFESKQGEAMFSVAVGMFLPMISPQIPQQYRKYVTEVAGELNAQGFDIGFTMIGDSIGPIIKTVTSQLTDTFKEVAEQETEETPVKTRVVAIADKQVAVREEEILAATPSVLSK